MENERWNPPVTVNIRPIRTFQTLAEAVAFIAHCLESNSAIQLLAETNGIGRQISRSPSAIDRFKETFGTLQTLHQQHDLRILYRDSHFPTESDRFQLGGYLSEQADLTIEFVRCRRGWVLEKIEYL